MRATEPLALNHSWPLFGCGSNFDLGLVGAPDMAPIDADEAWLATQGIGQWHCDLATQGLRWSSSVYDLFGWQRDHPVNRDGVLPLYRCESLSAVERLRSYAIRHRRGFTIDAQIHANGGSRWIRVTGVPVCRHKRVIALRGWKKDVTAEYC